MLDRGIYRVACSQVVVTLVVSGGFFLVRGWDGAWSEGGFEALSALYGGTVTILATLWMGRYIRRAGKLGIGNPTRGKWTLYAGTAQRFSFIVAALALGMGALKLGPLPLLAAFAAAQLGYIFAASRC